MANNRHAYDEALNRGVSYVWDQEWQNAIGAFEEAIAEFPHEPAPYDGMGTAYASLEQYDQALENFKQAAKYSRGDIMHLRHVADMQERLGQLSDAGKTYMAIGEIELNRRRLKDAMDNWHRAVRLEPNLLRAHQRLAAIYKRQGAMRNAIREYLAIARVLQGQGEPNKALQACKLALELDPRNSDVLTAIEMIKGGEALFANEAASAGQKAGTGLLGRASIGFQLEDDWESEQRETETAVPVQVARQTAMAHLAGQLFGDDDVDLSDTRQQTQISMISKALDFQRRGLTSESISAYEQAISAGVDNTAVHFNLGLLYQDKMRFEDGIKEFEISVKDHEYRLASHFALGESHRARGRTEKAIEHFIQVLKIVDLKTVRHGQADRLIELYENLSDSLITKGEPEKASAFANALVEFLSHRGWEDKAKEARSRLDAMSDAGMMILGDVMTAGSQSVLESLYLSQEYTRRGMYITAIEESYRAIQLAPDYIPAHLQLADILAKQNRPTEAALKFSTVAETYRVRGDINGAITAYEKVVELQPLELNTHGRLIELLKRHGQIDRALTYYMLMADAYYQLAQVDRAREKYQEALKLVARSDDEVNWKTRLLQATADIDMRRFEWQRALLAYRELRQLDPSDERAAITLIDLYYRVGQPVNAVRELDQYLVQLVRSGRSGKVVGILEDMVQQRPGDANLVDRLSRLYLQQKRQKEAIALLDRLGEAQLDAGDNEGAAATIQKILKLNPPNAKSYQQVLARLQ